MERHHSQQTEIQASSAFERLSLLPSAGEIAVPSGYTALGLGTIDDNLDRSALAKLAAKVLEDPLLMRRLGDRVYELMQADLRNQQERSRNYGRSF